MGHRLSAAGRDGVDTGSGAASSTPDGLVGQPVVAIGTDLVDIDRIRQVIDRQPGFVDRVYTEGERDYCERRRDPAERYAARFAAKEAVLKALGTGLGGADFGDIEVVRLDTGEPTLRITGRAAARAAELGIDRWLLTMTHSEHLAQAFVAALGPGRLAPR
ncbi:MAG: holo-ACP synthase [Actinomycetota bacterium]